MSKKLTVALDCDGVLFDCNKYVLELAEKVTGRQLPPVHKHVHFEFDKSLGLTYGEWTKVQAAILDSHATRDMEWLIGATSFVERLIDNGHDVYFLTSHWREAPHWVVDRELRLGRMFPTCDVVFAHNKTRARFDLLLDDKFETVKAVGPDLAILFDRPWNADSNWTGHRASGYDHAMEIITAKVEGKI